MFKRQIIILFSILWVHSLGAETLRLNSGETLKGRIRAMDEQILYLDSELTSQQLKVERSDIRLIEFDEVLRSMTRRLGLGLFYRPNGSVEEISVKNWLFKPMPSNCWSVTVKELPIYSALRRVSTGFSCRKESMISIMAPEAV